MKLTGAKAAGYAKRPAPSAWAILVFSEDEGVAADAARAVMSAWTPKGGELETITLDEDAVKREPALLFDELEAQSLLGEDRAIRIRTSGDKIAALLIEALKMGEATPGRFGAKLLVSAGALQKRAKLRSEFESAKQAVSLQLFADEIGDINTLVKNTLADAGAGIEADALAAFVGDLPGHRGLANKEIEKLTLYAEGLGRDISVADIRALSATDVDHALGSVISLMLSGHGGEAQIALDRLLIAGTSSISVLRAIQREVQRMLQAHQLGGGSGSNIGMKLRPPVWQSEWGAFSARLRAWSPKRLARILERLYDAELQAKASGASAEPVLRILINDLARVAAPRPAA